MDLKHYETQLEEAMITCDLVKEGAEVAIKRMCQAGNIDADRIAQIGNAITSAIARVDYYKKEIATLTLETLIPRKER